MRETELLISVVIMLILMVGCQDRSQSAAPSSAETNAPPAPTSTQAAANRPTDAWLGQWIGPEGTYLRLSSNGEKYVVKIQSLDGPATYEGVASGERIQFERQGKTEFIRSGSGEETGMKWLLGKKNCLIIKTGEGFCRD
jgi:hypothetical protein